MPIEPPSSFLRTIPRRAASDARLRAVVVELGIVAQGTSMVFAALGAGTLLGVLVQQAIVAGV